MLHVAAASAEHVATTIVRSQMLLSVFICFGFLISQCNRMRNILYVADDWQDVAAAAAAALVELDFLRIFAVHISFISHGN